METTSSSTKSVKIIRWIARIVGTALAAIFLTLVIGEIITKGGLRISDPGNRIMMFFFLLAQAGLLLAWRWEGLGGFLAAGCIVVTLLLRTFWVEGANGRDPTTAFFIWLIPALLFIYCWWRSREKTPAKAVQIGEA
jgi:hypothetical protein